MKKNLEAIQELNKSQDILLSLEKQQNCAKTSNRANCESIIKLLGISFGLLAKYSNDIGDFSNAEKYYQLSIESSLKMEEYERRLTSLTAWYISRDSFDQAVKSTLTQLEGAITSDNKQKTLVTSKVAEEVYRQLFDSISWDVTTGGQRDRDPRDFADMWGLSIGRKFKYGMTSIDEDEATFFTVFVIQGIVQKHPKVFSGAEDLARMGYKSLNELKADVDIEGYIRGQLLDNNIEPSAKYLYHIYIEGNFYNKGIKDEVILRCANVEPDRITFNEIKGKLEQSPSLAISPRTIHIIELLYQGDLFLKKHCKHQGA